MRRAMVWLSVLAMALLIAAPASAANQRGANGSGPIVPDHVYVDGDAYDTIILGSLPWNEQNSGSFNDLYPVFLPNGDPAQGPVAEFAPGDTEYRGGRWVPEPVTWTQAAVTNGDVVLITSIAQLHELERQGLIVSAGEMPGAAFLCPLLPG